jgi:hypothetical protein
MIDYIYKKKLFFSFVFAVLLLSLPSGCILGISYYIDPEPWERQNRMLDSLRRLPQFSEVSATLELIPYSMSNIHYVYRLTIKCKAPGPGCAIVNPGALNRYIQSQIVAGGEAFDGVRLKVENCYELYYQPLIRTKISKP